MTCCFLIPHLFLKLQQVRIRGRGWNRGNYLGNCSQSNNMLNMAAHPKNEDWDPEYTPKSRKYYLVGLISFQRTPSKHSVVVANQAQISTSAAVVWTPPCSFCLSLSTMTEMGSSSGWTIEGEDGEASCAVGHVSSSAKPLGAPTLSAPNGPMTSSRSMGSKVASRKRRQNRTIKTKKLMESILEQRSSVLKC